MASVKGQLGRNFNDRERAGNVRNLALDRVLGLLKKGKGRLYEQILIRLAGSILPRLNELTGEDGKAIIVELSEVIARKNNVAHPRTN